MLRLQFHPLFQRTNTRRDVRSSSVKKADGLANQVMNVFGERTGLLGTCTRYKPKVNELSSCEDSDVPQFVVAVHPNVA